MSIGRVPGVTGIQPSIVDAKGDLIVATAADSVDRLAVGSANQVLTVDSSTATGLKWATPAGGKVLQVIQAFKDDTFTTSSTTYTDVTGLSVSITPSANTSTILVLGYVNLGNLSAVKAANMRLVRGSTAIAIGAAAGSRTQVTGRWWINDAIDLNPAAFTYLDSPATTSSTTYKIQVSTSDAAHAAYVNRAGNDGDFAVVPRGASSIIVLEIGA